MRILHGHHFSCTNHAKCCTIDEDEREFTEKRRILTSLLPPSDSRQIVVLTGARQTGKTTLTREKYPDRGTKIEKIAEQEIYAMPARRLLG